MSKQPFNIHPKDILNGFIIIIMLFIQMQYVVVQFYPLFKILFWFLGVVMYNNEFEAKENKIQTNFKMIVIKRK